MRHSTWYGWIRKDNICTGLYHLISCEFDVVRVISVTIICISVYGQAIRRAALRIRSLLEHY